jgi:hypothetical protein
MTGREGSSVRVGRAGIEGYSVISWTGIDGSSVRVGTRISVGIAGIEGSCVGSAGRLSSGTDGSSMVGNVEGIAGIDGSSVTGMEGSSTVGIVAGNESVGSIDGINAIRDFRMPVSNDGSAILTAGIVGIAVNVRVGNGDCAAVPEGRTDWDGRIPAGIEKPPNCRLRGAVSTPAAVAAAAAIVNIIEVRTIFY